jgi:hypothetical protein
MRTARPEKDSLNLTWREPVGFEAMRENDTRRNESSENNELHASLFRRTTREDIVAVRRSSSL